MVSPEETPELAVEDVLRLWPAVKTHLYGQDEVRSVLQDQYIDCQSISITSWLLSL